MNNQEGNIIIEVKYAATKSTDMYKEPDKWVIFSEEGTDNNGK